MKLNAIIAAAALTLSTAVHAAPTYQGAVNFVDPEFGLFSKGGLTGPFDLYWDFVLAGGPWSATSSVTSRVNGTKDVDFSSVFLTDGVTTQNFIQSGFDPAEAWQLAPVTLLDNVVYEIHAIGSATGGAAFAGEVQLTAAVPEPSSVALVLIGLGAIGLATRRRSKIA